MGTLYDAFCTFMNLSEFFLEWEMFQTNVVENFIVSPCIFQFNNR